MMQASFSGQTDIFSSAAQNAYAVILIRSDLDRHRHNETFARELSYAFGELGLRTVCIDYVRDVRQLAEAMRDADCQFFVGFNGFGSELAHASGRPGMLASAFEVWKKPLFDLMHDCPVHETMEHQFDSIGPFRRAMFTDYSYAHLSRLLGTENVQSVPSITFPRTHGTTTRPIRDRATEILLPLGLCDPQVVRDRFGASVTYKHRLYREMFESVVAYAVDDLSIDPLTQLLVACQDAGLATNLRDADYRFLLTAVLDYVKFARRDALLKAISHLPVTIISDRDVSHRVAGPNLKLLDSCAFDEVIGHMSDSRIVVCPLPHHTGFHERALAAFTAGAAVFAAPNEILETNFWQGREMMTYRSPQHLASLLERALAGDIDLEALAANGARVAHERFAPQRLAAIMLSQWSSLRASA